MDSFYITLPSNVVNPSFKNKANHYKTHLPTELDLKGKWQCALSEISFDKKWKTVQEDTKVILTRYVEVRGAMTLMDTEIKVDAGYYITPHDYFTTFMERFEAFTVTMPGFEHYYKSIKLEFEEVTGKITLQVEGIVRWYLRFEEKIWRMIGLPTLDYLSFVPPLTICVWTPPAEMLSTPCLYVYCDVIEDNIVGNVRAKLLRTVAVSGQHHSRVNHIYTMPYYHPVRPGYISDIEIKICDGEGEKIKFGRSNTILVLHFRQHNGI